MHSYLEHDMKRARQCLQNPFSQMMNQNFDGEFRALAFLFYVYNIYVIWIIYYEPYYMANMDFHS